eukprot:COSAG02_NODE_108_length_36286_cov_19.437478_23_plen_98_part_00
MVCLQQALLPSNMSQCSSCHSVSGTWRECIARALLLRGASAFSVHSRRFQRPQTQFHKPPVLHGCHVLRNYLKIKVLCASVVCVNASKTYYVTIVFI